ncbi:Hsp20/alpha crystallin family protein [Candidatus Nomurabacteria bacterium]|nr:Hsp20/alpha crystallin family protein [Candidatus Nomurabacteria bacterium]
MDSDKTIKENEIRYQIDESTGLLYFSIIDIIGALDLSTDPRNYWKVLKNRLKKNENKLLAECNQLKMKSSDGKYYLTDVADRDIVLKIIESISPNKVQILKKILNKIEKENEKSSSSNEINGSESKKLPTILDDDGEISLDLYQKDDAIVVVAMLAGVEPQNIFLSLSTKTLTIKVNRTKQNIPDENYYFSELSWGKFSKIVELPYEVDIDKVEATFERGVLKINLLILDKERERIIKVK